MSNKQKVIVALTFASETCTASLSALSSNLADNSTIPQTTDLSIILKDFESLLSLIYASATKISLALKPSSPTYSASFPIIQDLSKHTFGLVHCINLINPDIHGLTLKKEVVHVTKNIIEAIRALVQTLLNIAARGPPASSGQAGEEYLLRTGTIHELIDNLRSKNGLSTDNLSAVRKKWKEDKGPLEDGLREVGEMIEDANQENSDDLDDESDGWDELGLGGKKMDKDELERATNVHTILRLTTLLHKRILLDLLSSTSFTPSDVDLDVILAQSGALLVASDDLAATLYAPQDPRAIYKELQSYLDIVKALQTGIQPYFPVKPDLELQFGRLTVNGDESNTVRQSDKDKASEKWFNTCFDQISKVGRTFENVLKQNTDDAVRGS